MFICYCNIKLADFLPRFQRNVSLIQKHNEEIKTIITSVTKLLLNIIPPLALFLSSSNNSLSNALENNKNNYSKIAKGKHTCVMLNLRVDNEHTSRSQLHCAVVSKWYNFHILIKGNY